MSGIQIISKEPIERGWSCDTKYRAIAEDGTSYFLRITPTEKSASREPLFRILKQVEALGIPMCRPVEFSVCPEGVYMLLTWIDGEDARTVMPRLSLSEQYSYGREAGAILKKLHSIPAPESQPDWESRFNQKLIQRSECITIARFDSRETNTFYTISLKTVTCSKKDRNAFSTAIITSEI